MKIEIEQQDNTFKFSKNNSLIYYGDYIVSSFKIVKRLFNIKNEKIAEIKTRIGIKGIRFEILFINSLSPVILKLKGGLLKNYYECFYKETFYKVIKHKGHLTSIFMNENQIGFYERKKITTFGNQKIIFYCNNNIDQELIFTFIFALELLTQEQNESITFNLGNFTKEYKPFDDKWKPKVN